MLWDKDLEGPICRECRPHIREAEDVLRMVGIPPINRGPFHGNSIG